MMTAAMWGSSVLLSVLHREGAERSGEGTSIMNNKIVRGGLAGVAVLALAAGGSTFA